MFSFLRSTVNGQRATIFLIVVISILKGQCYAKIIASWHMRSEVLTLVRRLVFIFPIYRQRITIFLNVVISMLKKDLESGSKLFLNKLTLTAKKLKLLHIFSYNIFSSKEFNLKIESCLSH